MQKIIIGFSSPNKWKIGAEAIKMWTASDYSHCYIRFVSSDPEIPSNVYHAASGHVHFVTYENFLKTNRTVKEYHLDVTPEERKKILIKCMKLSFTGYGTIELVKIFGLDILHFVGINNVNTKNSKGYICSELISEVLAEKFNLKFDKPQYLLKPSDIDKSLKQRFTAILPTE